MISIDGMKILHIPIPIWNIIYNLTKSYERAIPIRSRDSKNNVKTIHIAVWVVFILLK